MTCYLSSFERIDCLRQMELKTFMICKHCKTILSPTPEKNPKYYKINKKKYQSRCYNCRSDFPKCCVKKCIHSEVYYKNHPQYVVSKYETKINLCRSCIKAVKRQKKEEENQCDYCCTNLRDYAVDEDTNTVFPLSSCKKCDWKACKWCSLNGLCISCHNKLGSDTKGLKVGDRVIFLGEDNSPPTLTEATVLKIYHESKEVKIRCDRYNEGDYKPRRSIQRIWRNLLRKI